MQNRVPGNFEKRILAKALTTWPTHNEFRAANSSCAKSILKKGSSIARDLALTVGISNFKGDLNDPRTIVARLNNLRKQLLLDVAQHLVVHHAKYRLGYNPELNSHIIIKLPDSLFFQLNQLVEVMIECSLFTLSESLMLETVKILARADKALCEMRPQVLFLQSLGISCAWTKSSEEWFYSQSTISIENTLNCETPQKEEGK